MSSAGRTCCPSRWTHHKGLASASEEPSCKPSGCCQATLSPLSHCGPGKLSFLRLCSPPQHMACPAMLKMEILRWTNTHVPVLEEKRLPLPIEGHSMHLVSSRLSHFPCGFSVFPTLYILICTRLLSSALPLSSNFKYSSHVMPFIDLGLSFFFFSSFLKIYLFI